MMQSSRPVALAVVLALLAACQTTGGRSTYEAPLRKAGIAAADTTRATAGSPASNERTSHVETDTGVLVDDNAIHYGGVDYSVRDLSPGTRPANDTDEAGLWMVMDRAEREAITAGNRIDDSALNAYISDIGCRVAAEYCGDLRIYLIRRPAFNATMAPNGMMSVWTGLLLRVRNEAQLATVLGHELGHYLRRHTLQRMRDIVAKTNGLIFFQLAVGAAGAGPIGDIAALGVLGSIQSYNRDQEREADGYGLLFLHRAGYDPREAAKIWAQLLRERDADPDKESPSLFFASHPPSEERRDVLAELGTRLQRQSGATKTGRDRFLAHTLAHRGVWLRDELNLRKFESTDVMLDELLADDPNPAELYFFKGELRRLRAKEGDDVAALEFYDKAVAATGTAPVELSRSRGVVLLRQGENAAATQAFQAYLDAAPEAPDRLIIEDMIRRLSVS